jgi:hypothetical protein
LPAHKVNIGRPERKLLSDDYGEGEDPPGLSVTVLPSHLAFFVALRQTDQQALLLKLFSSARKVQSLLANTQEIELTRMPSASLRKETRCPTRFDMLRTCALPPRMHTQPAVLLKLLVAPPMRRVDRCHVRSGRFGPNYRRLTAPAAIPPASSRFKRLRPSSLHAGQPHRVPRRN